MNFPIPTSDWFVLRYLFYCSVGAVLAAQPEAPDVWTVGGLVFHAIIMTTIIGCCESISRWWMGDRY